MSDESTNQSSESPRDTAGDTTGAQEPGSKADAARAAKETNQVEEKLSKEQELGYRGYKPDPTPNEHYTLAGVVEGLPVPETMTHPERVRLRAEAEARLGDAEAEHFAKSAERTKAGKGK